MPNRAGCYSHNVPLRRCPSKIRCVTCKTLTNLGWRLIKLALKIAGDRNKQC